MPRCVHTVWVRDGRSHLDRYPKSGNAIRIVCEADASSLCVSRPEDY